MSRQDKRTAVGDMLEEMVQGTMYLQCKEIKGAHTVTPDRRYIGKFTDKWSTLYVETQDNADHWEHVYAEFPPATRKRKKGPKAIHTWQVDYGMDLASPKVPTDPDRVMVYADPWAMLSGVDQVLGWGGQWASDAEQEDSNVVIGHGYAASFGESDGIVSRTTGDMVPEGSHVRTTLRTLDLFMGFAVNIGVEESNREDNGPEDAPRFMCWHDSLAVYIRVEVPTREMYATLQFLRQRGDDPRVPLVEKIWADPAAVVTVGARAARLAAGTIKEDEKDRPVTLYADGGGFSIRSGRRKPVEADLANGEGEATISNRLIANALYWFLDGAVEVTLPKRAGEPVLVAEVNRDTCIMLLPW